MTDPLRGLSPAEAASRRAQGLGNFVPLKSSRTYVQIFLENVFTFMNNVLFGLGIALVVLGRTSDALVSIGVISVNVIVSVVQEIRAKRTLDKIAVLTRPTATVLRDGKELVVDPNEAVVGDILIIRPGDQIIVDGQVVGPGKFDADESMLTGEADAVSKHAGDLVYSGSFCLSGSALYEAQKVGAQSMANQLTASARAFRRVLTPLQQQINFAIRVLLLIAVYFEILLVIDTFLNKIPLVESVKHSVVIAGLVPNGLFLAIAVAYALGAVRIAGKGALVQQANAVESLSNVDTLCLDKTGTITSNKILFHAVHPLGIKEAELRRLLGIFAASLSTPNKTSAAIAAACPGKAHPASAEVEFTSELKWSALVFDQPNLRGSYFLGAPELLQKSLKSSGDFKEILETWTNQGLRVLLLAFLPESVPLTDSKDKAHLPHGLIPLGLVALSDVLRPQAAKTLAGFAASGVTIKIISGDNPLTVCALARQAGLGPELEFISGPELVGLDEAAFAALVEKMQVFGRISPAQKDQIIQALKKNGHYVAMIGDGVNDVLSLKQANLGIAMQSGSQAARSVADIILMGDSFASLPYAIREGQRILNGMQDILKLFMTRVLYAGLLILSVEVLGTFPFSPKQASLFTLFSVGLPTLALAAWAHPGTSPRQNLIRQLMHFVLPAALTLMLTSLAIFAAILIPNYQAVIAANPGIRNVMAMQQAAIPAQTAVTIYTALCGLLLLVFVEPPTPHWVGGDSLSRDKRPAYLALGLLVIFLAIVAIQPIARFFDLTPLPLWIYPVLMLSAAGFGFLVRWFWRSHLLERFLSIDFTK